MAEIGIEVRGRDEILGLLRAIGPDLRQTLQPAADAILSMLYSHIRPYPPERPGQRYQRTNDLGNSWLIEDGPGSTGDEELGRVVSYGPGYNALVQDENEQAGIHAGRWQTVQSVARDREQQAQEIVEAVIAALLQ